VSPKLLTSEVLSRHLIISYRLHLAKSKPVLLPYTPTDFPNSCHHQKTISITDSWGIKHVPSPESQYPIDVTLSLSIGRDTNVPKACLW
jgi:hypothetical protein